MWERPPEVQAAIGAYNRDGGDDAITRIFADLSPAKQTEVNLWLLQKYCDLSYAHLSPEEIFLRGVKLEASV